MNSKVELSVIGIIKTAFPEPTGTPIQPNFAKNSLGIIEINEKYLPALKDLDGFSHIWLIYFFHKASPYQETVIPFRDIISHGVLATRAPTRPNQIGISVVKLDRIESNKIFISNVDIVNESPLLDIKPYVPSFDSRPNATSGWLEQNANSRKVADSRFIKSNQSV